MSGLFSTMGRIADPANLVGRVTKTDARGDPFYLAAKPEVIPYPTSKLDPNFKPKNAGTSALSGGATVLGS